LIEYLDSLPPMARALDKPFRMPVMDRYKDMGSILIGKVESGICCKNQTCLLMPNRVRPLVLTPAITDIHLFIYALVIVFHATSVWNGHKSYFHENNKVHASVSPTVVYHYMHVPVADLCKDHAALVIWRGDGRGPSGRERQDQGLRRRWGGTSSCSVFINCNFINHMFC